MKNLKTSSKRRQRGIALISVLLILVLLIVVGISLMYVADTDTAINANYRSEQQAYFAAKAGIEEVRDRMRVTNTFSLDPKGASLLPTTVASDSGGVLYVINQGADPITVQPWTAGNRYQDDEICHDGYTMTGIPAPGAGVPADDVRCPNPPSGPSTWYSKPTAGAAAPGWKTSTAPFNGTAAALPYKWVRLTWKQNNSIQGNGNPPYYTVDGSAPASATGTTPVCWDGNKEVLLQSPATKCEDMPNGMRPVYLTTSLAISAGGSRRMVQAELAKNVLPTFPAAIALDGPEATFSPYTSASSNVSGWDAATSGGGTPCPPSGNWPGIGTYTDYDATQVRNAVSGPPTKPGNWTGGPLNDTSYNALNIGPWGYYPGGPPTGPQYADASNTSTYDYCPGSGKPAPYSPFCPGQVGNLNQLSTVSGLVQLQNTVIQSADLIVPAGGSAALPLGTPTNPQITVFMGDASFSGGSSIGSGILLVEGTLNISGTMSFDEAIYVVGKGVFITSGTPSYGGQVLIANLATPPPNPPNAAILSVLQKVYGPGTTQYPSWVPGSPTFIGGGGGGGGVNYNSCKANLGNDRITYKVLATREILY